MDKRDELIILYDYYGELLNDDNKRFFEDYYFDNLSLKEIAENNDISRNAVHKHLKNSQEKLEFYELKLGLFKRDKLIKSKINEINDKKIKEIVEKILF